MEQDFKSRHAKFVSQYETLETAMFALGIQLGSFHHKDRVGLYNPVKDKLKSLWDAQDLRKIQQGADDEGYYDDTSEDLDYEIRRAVELNRPDWGFFYLIGTIKGNMNGGRVSADEFLHCFKLLPVSFLEKYGQQLVELCNYFEENNKILNLKVEIGGVYVAFESKN